MNKFLVSSLFFISHLSLAQIHHHHQGHYAHLPTDGRRALHGMVLFGSGPYFIEHIPMLTPPHDFQIVTEVVLKKKDGFLLKTDFSNQGFTLKPNSQFSLNDFVVGRLHKFNGAIHQGNFETNGQMMRGLEDVRVEIKSNLFVSQLPKGPSRAQVIRFSDGKNTFKSNVISTTQSFQMIQNEKTGKVLWCVKGPDFFDPC